MMLISLKFEEAPRRETAWFLDDLTFSQVNLFVGKNATGKTRAINAIHYLSTLLSGQRREVISTCSFDTLFTHGETSWKYILKFVNGIVTFEELTTSGDKFLHRGEGGLGKIRTLDDETKTQSDLRFKVPGAQLALVAKRDDIQHPFLTPFFDWGESVRLFRFGLTMNPQNLSIAILVKDIKIAVNEKETAYLVPIFDKANKEFGKQYIDDVISDMKELGYEIESIEIRRPQDLVLASVLPGELHGISVKERDIEGPVDQNSISQGMFRAISLIAQINYYAHSGRKGLVLVDDIGEGLDYDRSCAIIDVLRTRSQKHGFQVVMSTNDRFVMNRVPLEEWCVLQRKGHHVQVRNYQNSKAAFERFKLTGLNNFDLLRTDFLEKVAVNEQNGDFR